MPNLDDFFKRDYEILHGLIGKEKTDEYFKKNGHHLKHTFYKITFEEFKKLYKEHTLLSILIIFAISLIIWQSL